MLLRRLDRLAQLRHQQPHALAGGVGQKRLGRLVPVMSRQCESAPVNGQKRTTAQQRERLQRVMRPQMDITPRGMMAAHLQQGEVERAEPFTDGCELCRQPGIAAEEHAVTGRADDHRGP